MERKEGAEKKEKEMRIIAGEKKGSRLFSLSGNHTRPTTDFVKEAIFDIIYDCDGLKVLDLFSGSGGLGFEALSRGARELFLVDISEKAIQTIKKNAEKLEYSDVINTYRLNAVSFLHSINQQFDLIMLDPPYNKNWVNRSLDKIFEFNTLADEGMIVVEHSQQEKIAEQYNSLINKQKKYGDTFITILTN